MLFDNPKGPITINLKKLNIKYFNQTYNDNDVFL